MASHEPILRQQDEMPKDTLDALVAMSPDNVGYTAGYMVPSQVVSIRHRHFMCIVTLDGATKMIVASPEYSYAQEMSRIQDIRPYDLFRDSPMQVLAEELAELGLAGARIGLETDFIPAAHFAELKLHLPHADFVSARATFARARMVKSKPEIEKLQRAARIADSARQMGCGRASAGMTERDLYRLIVDSALREGADGVSSVQVGSGYRSAFGNPPPTDKTLEPTELVKLDILLQCEGYVSDTGKAAVVTRATEFQRSMWNKLIETQSAILDRIKPGVSTRELWQVFVDKFKQFDLEPSILFLGHGIGLSVHEDPYITAHSDTVLEPGMVFCIEPVYKLPGEMGFHIEDEVVVTDDGYELFTDFDGARELAVIAARRMAASSPSQLKG